MQEEKAKFIKKLERFYIEDMKNPKGIKRLDYKYGNIAEWLYVTFKSGSQKRVNISCDNEQGILFDFVNFLGNTNDWEWLIGKELVDFDEE